ncbi:MAG TPA: hypothetical protein VNL15_01140, partial [Dehalococcoidia bacterium]|nr:hypothetical protein [Dehalococcoidia bacterium]
YTSNGQPGEDVIEVCEDAATPVLCTTAIKHWALLLKFGDADCNGTMTVTDAIKLQQTIAGIPVTQIEPCPDIESDVSVLIGSVD